MHLGAATGDSEGNATVAPWRTWWQRLRRGCGPARYVVTVATTRLHLHAATGGSAE
ncbi:MAG: hypothetical protein GY719_16395 [bacterium]|nr:hypothetical protein [bacterium]